MIVFRSPEDIPDDFGRTVVAIGKFDGVHAGHRAVIARAREEAARHAAKTVAVTFDRHPLSILRPESCPDSLVSVERKLELLAETGVDAALVLTFDEAMAARSADDFIEGILVDALRVIEVLVGADFRFGHGGSGTVALLRDWGHRRDFAVEVVDDVHLPGADRRVSSSWIRTLLAQGDVETAAAALAVPVAVRGEVVHGLKRGRELGFPTANLSRTLDALIPADGVYAGWMIDHVTGVRHPSAISVGTNPTFDDVPVRQVEAHVIDEDGFDFYGHDVTVEFVRHLRGMTAFDGIEALKAQISDDVRRSREVLFGS